MEPAWEHQLRDNLERLVTANLSAVALLRDSITILHAHGLVPRGLPTRTEAPSACNELSPTVDRRVMSVVFRGKCCFLGDTIMLRLMEHLIQRPNQYVAYRTLLDEVWKAHRDPSSIRSVVKQLRSRLGAAGMSELAAAIEGHHGHYALMLPT